MKNILGLVGGAALFALAGCTHEAPGPNAPPRPASETMESQTNDMGEPFLSSPKSPAPPSSPDAVPNGREDCFEPSRSDLAPGAKPCGHQDGTPEPNENPMPKKIAPSAP